MNELPRFSVTNTRLLPEPANIAPPVSLDVTKISSPLTYRTDLLKLARLLRKIAVKNIKKAITRDKKDYQKDLSLELCFAAVDNVFSNDLH